MTSRGLQRSLFCQLKCLLPMCTNGTVTVVICCAHYDFLLACKCQDDFSMKIQSSHVPSLSHPLLPVRSYCGMQLYCRKFTGQDFYEFVVIVSIRMTDYTFQSSQSQGLTEKPLIMHLLLQGYNTYQESRNTCKAQYIRNNV